MIKRVVVLGAGIAGLSAAYDLQKAGFDVTVLERESIAGGRMGNMNVGSVSIATGASILFSFYDDMMALVREVGLEKDLVVLPKGEAFMVDNGRIVYEVDAEASIRTLLASPVLSWRTKLRLPLIFPARARARKRTDPNMAEGAAYLDHESMADYVGRVIGKDFVEGWLEPWFRGNWNWEPENISNGYFMSLFAHLGRETKILTFREGIGQLSRALASRLNVRLNTCVEKVRRVEGGGWVVAHTEDGRTGQLEADLVVCAVPGIYAATLFYDLTREEQAFFSSVRYTKCAGIYYIVNKPLQFWMRAYTREHPSIFCIYATALPEVRTSPGMSSLYGELSPVAVADVAAKGGSAVDLDAYCRAEMFRHYPTLEQDLVEVHQMWWDDMLPEFYPGYISKMSEFLLTHQSPSDRYFCGDYLAHAHTGGACASGRRVARQIIEHWGAG